MGKINLFKGSKKSEIDEAALQKELAQFLQIDNLNFLIGAGCSSEKSTGLELGIPGMRDLYNDFFAENPNFMIAGQDVRNQFDGNLEKMLECMQAILVSNSISVVDAEINEKICAVQKFIKKNIEGGVDSSEVLKIYHDFYMKTVLRNRKTPINIFTTNYDLFNEQALDSLSFPYNDGFIGTYKRVFNPACYKYAYVEDMNLSKDVWERVPNFYNLYKIHGSITWMKKDNAIYETDYRFIGESDTVMIYPTPLKDRSTLLTPYSDLFRAMEGALLRKNSVLITLGYSFSDEHINRVILNSLAIPTFKLIIIGESENIKKLIDLNDNRIVVINSDDKIHYFKNFVEKAMPDTQEDVKEMIDMPTVAKIIKSFEGEKNE